MSRELNYIETVQGLHKNWTPHKAQATMGRALFRDGFTRIFGKCGRNFGKTDFIAYCLWRYAREYPGSENYYFAPLQKQAKEIVWATDRLQSFGPRHWLEEGSRGINNSELRLRFLNKSYIKMDGSDNIDSYRGVKPKGLIVYDEYKDFRSGFHLAFEPNLDAYNSPLIVIGTPPEIEDHHFYKMEDDFKEDENKAHFEYTSYENPHIDPELLNRRKTELYRRGEGDVWEREYMVKKVFGGKNSIFPMLDTNVPGAHIRPHKELTDMLRRDQKKMRFIQWSDPGTTTCHATLFAAFNPYNRKLYLLDEHYETEQAKTSTSIIGKELQTKREEYWNKAEWDMGYDEAAAWFQVEMANLFDLGLIPTNKSTRPKDKCLSVIKDMLLFNMLVVSDRCENFLSEARNYMKDDKGKVPKENDHLLDDLRYILDFLAYDFIPTEEQRSIELKNQEEKPWYKISDDFPHLNDDAGEEDEDF